MTEPQRVDWTIEDTPSCADCVHCEPDDHWTTQGEMELALKYARCKILPNFRYYCVTRRTYDDECGSSAKFFERKPHEHGNYDFETDPPIAMGWV